MLLHSRSQSSCSMHGIIRYCFLDSGCVCGQYALSPVAGAGDAKYEQPSRWLRVTSCLVLASFAGELALLVSLGSVRSRSLLGPGFYVAHVILFFLGPPALANLLVLRAQNGFFAKWYVAGALCTVFAFFLVLLQYTVSESLYGIE
jgi:hypothetical protein